MVDDYLDDEDWQTLKQIKEFLEPLKAYTKSLESSTRGLDSVLPAMDFILAHFETAKVQYRNNKVFHYSTLIRLSANFNKVLSAMINSRWQKMNKWYAVTNDSPVYAAAIVLHPSMKWGYIELKWRKDWIKPTKKKVKKL